MRVGSFSPYFVRGDCFEEIFERVSLMGDM